MRSLIDWLLLPFMFLWMVLIVYRRRILWLSALVLVIHAWSVMLDSMFPY